MSNKLLTMGNNNSNKYRIVPNAFYLKTFRIKPNMCNNYYVMHQILVAMHISHVMTSFPWQRFLHCLPFMCGLLRSPVDSIHKGSANQSYDVSIFVSLNKLWNKQSTCQWFETPDRTSDITEMTLQKRVETSMTVNGSYLRSHITL